MAVEKSLTKQGVKRRLRRRFRRQRRDIEELGLAADQNLDKLLLRRLNRLKLVRRFVGLWIALFVLMFFAGVSQFRSMSSYYQSLQSVPGGIYSEGLVGAFNNANPLYADGAADTAVSRLVFSGLFKYDTDDRLVPDLATGYTLNDNQTVYTVSLRHDVSWQDGAPFTSADVVYTYHTIQNTEAQSPLFSSWQDVSVAAHGPYQVTFTLDNPLGSFPYNLTNGIIPKHLLQHIPAGQLRSDDFNTKPVGTGPFAWRFISVTGNSDTTRQQAITLAPNTHYYGGRPKLDGFDLSIYRSDEQMIKAFDAKQISAMSGLDSIPPGLDKGLNYYNVPLNAITMAFFNNSHGALGDVSVRKALVSGVNRSSIIGLSGYPVNLVNGPLLSNQISYGPGEKQLPYDLKSAKQLLDSDGWAMSTDGFRHKNHQTLSFRMVSENTPQYEAVAQYLQNQWAKLGVKVSVINAQSEDLQGNIVPNHDYDILLYGISLGTDPDVFDYWDSSQAGTDSQGHLNLSEYKSSAADEALESARTRSKTSLRLPKYHQFLKTWRNDAPALALYQPNYLYITRSPVSGFERTAMDSPADRFYNVSNWMIREQRRSNL